MIRILYIIAFLISSKAFSTPAESINILWPRASSYKVVQLKTIFENIANDFFESKINVTVITRPSSSFKDFHLVIDYPENFKKQLLAEQIVLPSNSLISIKTIKWIGTDSLRPSLCLRSKVNKYDNEKAYHKSETNYKDLFPSIVMSSTYMEHKRLALDYLNKINFPKHAPCQNLIFQSNTDLIFTYSYDSSITSSSGAKIKAVFNVVQSPVPVIPKQYEHDEKSAMLWKIWSVSPELWYQEP